LGDFTDDRAFKEGGSLIDLKKGRKRSVCSGNAKNWPLEASKAEVVKRRKI